MYDLSKLKMHEEVDKNHFESLKKSLPEHGILERPIVCDRNTCTILDGHCRYTIFKKKLKIPKIPVFLFDYFDKRIVLESWVGKIVTKDEVVSMANSGKLFPPKTTKHMIYDGKKKCHISEFVPKIDVPLDELRKYCKKI